MSDAEKPERPRTPSTVTDWEAAFEDPETGLIALIAGARSPAALRKSAAFVIARLCVRKDDPAEIERLTAELNRLIPDDIAEEDLPPIAEAVTTILRQIKEDRKQKAAEFIEGEKRAQSGDSRKRVNKRKSAPREENLVSIVLGLGAGFIALAVFMFRSFAIKKTPSNKGKKAGKGKHKGKARAKEAFYQDGNKKVPDVEGEVLQDDDLFSLKDGKEQGVYMESEEVEKDDGEYESWDKY